MNEQKGNLPHTTTFLLLCKQNSPLSMTINGLSVCNSVTFREITLKPIFRIVE